ncbi:Beta-eliminating lyase [Marinobacter sp. es.042]|nr:Beta-eliminating lyase [Marinobacter sp. es.042]
MSQSEQFASDNYSGVCPQAWKAMEAANRMDEPAYGKLTPEELRVIRSVADRHKLNVHMDGARFLSDVRALVG